MYAEAVDPLVMSEASVDTKPCAAIHECTDVQLTASAVPLGSQTWLVVDFEPDMSHRVKSGFLVEQNLALLGDSHSRPEMTSSPWGLHSQRKSVEVAVILLAQLDAPVVLEPASLPAFVSRLLFLPLLSHRRFSFSPPRT